jgi:hypothetical protein
MHPRAVIDNPIVAKATAFQTVLNTHVLAMMDIAATPVSMRRVATLTNIEIVVMAPAFLVLFQMAKITRALVSLVMQNQRLVKHAACVTLDMGGQDRVEDNAPCAPAQNTKPQPAMHHVYHVKRDSTKAGQAKQVAGCVVQAQLPTLSVMWGQRHARHAHRVSTAQHLRCNAVSASLVRRQTRWRAVVLQHAWHVRQGSTAQHLRCNAVSAGPVRRRTRWRAVVLQHAWRVRQGSTVHRRRWRVYHVRRDSTKAGQAKQVAGCVVQARLPTLSVTWGRRHARHAHRVSTAQHLRCNAVSASLVRRQTRWRAVVLQHVWRVCQGSTAQHLRCNAVSAGPVRQRTRWCAVVLQHAWRVRQGSTVHRRRWRAHRARTTQIPKGYQVAVVAHVTWGTARIYGNPKLLAKVQFPLGF